MMKIVTFSVVCLLLASSFVDAGAATSSVTSASQFGRSSIVDGISDAISRTSKKFATAGTNNMLIGTDGFAKMYKDTVGRPVTTAGVAMQNMATSMSNSNKIFSDGMRASIDDTVSRPMASIMGTEQNLLASGGAAQGAWFDNAITKPFSLFGMAARDLLTSSFPADIETSTTTSSTASETGGNAASATSSFTSVSQPPLSASGQPLNGFPSDSLALSGARMW